MGIGGEGKVLLLRKVSMKGGLKNSISTVVTGIWIINMLVNLSMIKFTHLKAFLNIEYFHRAL